MIKVAMTAEAALAKLCSSAGPKADEVLTLLGKVLGNIVDHPHEHKFRRLNTGSAKLQSGLLCHAGAPEFLKVAGFVSAGDGHIELPQNAGTALIDARSAVIRRTEVLQRKRQADQMSQGVSQVASGYKAAVEGGAHGAGQAEIKAIGQQPGGPEALELLEHILVNIRRYPDSQKYKCVNLAKPAGQKVLPAAPLMLMAGFEQTKLPSGEDCLQLTRPNPDILERLWGMVWWTTRPTFTLEPRPAAGPMAHALGALVGAAIGDALGAPLGGRGPYEVTAEEVDKVLEMCGGGIWGVAPGQTTGNTELLVCLAEALATAKAPVRDFPIEDVAYRYGSWGRSLPFRGERASMQAFQRPLPADDMRQHAKDQNQKSMGSGALARCAPLAALAVAHQAPAACAALARADAELSHPSPSVGFASAALVFTIAHLAASGGDRNRALAEVEQWAKRELEAARSGIPAPLEAAAGGPAGWTHLSSGPQERVGKRTEEKQWSPPGEQLVAVEEMASWITKGVAGKEELSFSSSSAAALLNGEVGSVEIPLSHAFRHLKAGTSFEAAMRMVLAGGGDASTNAAVLGAMLGAVVGLDGLPMRWVQAVLTFDPALGQPRPPDYHPGQLPSIVQRIFAAAKGP